MERISSGCYIIDKEYNVVSVNETARSIYPQLQIGKKCYKCLLNLDAPCGPCPVAGGRKGPNTYVDPIRNIAETVDAVEMDLAGHGRCHAMIFSTVDDDASFAATLPNSAEGLKNLALVKALTVDYYDVFTVRLTDGILALYRHDGKPIDANSVFKQITSYDTGTENYIRTYVLDVDRERMQEQTSIAYMQERLKKTEHYVVHYRVFLNNEIHYYYRKIVRVGDAASFENVVIGVGCEDDEVLSRMRRQALEKNLVEVEYDTMTGLYTKQAFYIHGAELLKRYPKKKFDFCVAKIQNLGLINHQYSRRMGNHVIAVFGHQLQKYESDTSCIAYFGDGVFASFTENDPVNIRKANIRAFRDSVLQHSRVKNLSLKWAIYKELQGNVSVEEIYLKTQFALSTILAENHEDYVEFDQDMIQRMDWEEYVDRNFQAALDAGAFVAWYQPKYSTRTQKIVGAEALVRWQKPDGGIIAPGRFVPILETRGKIHQLDIYMFRQVCRLQKQRKDAGLPVLPISVNLSRASLFEEDLAQKYMDIAGEYGVNPASVPIEITESAAIRSESIQRLSQELIDKGFSLHMDDFGSGYSSLSSLQTISFDCIKLDKSLIDFIGTDSGDGLLKHTISFAKESGKTVTAEGVETLEQLVFLKVAGCDAVQGYYFSKPVDEETFLQMLAEG